ncbi:hypothetical protein [Candidatus Parabeggiatoa sp. HSG14]|uniref:hypothetical protein n=1 Tax=Candidatus Parabeggiatoa sp. HSG14 TaxID=3055593 RepID=UPI0025A73206|nr:hypothetical protein [Thiotrichales bacterium HSG14]
MENEERQIEIEKSNTKDSQFSIKHYQSREKMDLAECKKVLIKEIDLIQSIINRMSNTSFLIKGWAVTIMALIFSVKSDPMTLPFIFISILLFWFLDAYFLQQERFYRKLYKWVIQNRMGDDSYLFSLNTTRFKHGNKTYSSNHVLNHTGYILWYGTDFSNRLYRVPILDNLNSTSLLESKPLGLERPNL